jgi:hypothetical protein
MLFPRPLSKLGSQPAVAVEMLLGPGGFASRTPEAATRRLRPVVQSVLETRATRRTGLNAIRLRGTAPLGRTGPTRLPGERTLCPTASQMPRTREAL